ncbi:MAG: hypothetical protein AAGJ28_01040 [Pseudomonadota bacterium]
MKLKLALATAMTALGTAVAHAQSLGNAKGGVVPEIDALSGLAALAVVGAAVALIRERSK